MMKRTIAMLLMAINTIVLNSMYSSYLCQVNAENPTFSADRTKVIIKIEFIFYTVDLNNIFGTVKKQQFMMHIINLQIVYFNYVKGNLGYGKKIVAVLMLVAQLITGNISSELANGVNHHYTDDTMLKEISFAEVKDEDTELRVIYKVYTLQNVEGLDFCVVQAEVTGLPGADLGGDYESQYEGEKMSVNIEGAFNTIEKDVTISGGLSWTFDTYASYTLDSLWTAQEKIALDKSFTCTP